MASERSDHTLQSTALVHEAYLRLVDVERLRHWDSRGHFFAAAADTMRCILIDNARRRRRAKHGGDFHRASPDVLDGLVASLPDDELLALDEAIRLTQVPLPQQTQIGPCEPVTSGPFTRPKRSHSAWMLTAWLFLLIQSFGAVTQSQVYVLHRMALEPYARLNGMNDSGMVIGFHGSANGQAGSPQRGFIYDHLGLIGMTQAVHSVDEWIDTPAGWIGSSCVGINNDLQVVGYFSNSTGGRVCYFLDIVTGNWGLLPRPTWSAYSFFPESKHCERVRVMLA